MKICKTCDCGRTESIDLTDEEYKKYKKWRAGEIYIQEMNTLNPVEREFLKTGMCKECQEMIFGNGKSERLKAERK